MELRLIHEDPLGGQGARSPPKWEIRRALHPQRKHLWREHPLKDAAPTLLAHRPQPGKSSVMLEKDGRRVPHGSTEGRDEIAQEPDPTPFYCLLEDDSLVTKVTVEPEQLRRPAKPDEVVAINSVHVQKTMLSIDNMQLERAAS